jgi:hypothetical protein
MDEQPLRIHASYIDRDRDPWLEILSNAVHLEHLHIENWTPMGFRTAKYRKPLDAQALNMILLLARDTLRSLCIHGRSLPESILLLPVGLQVLNLRSTLVSKALMYVLPASLRSLTLWKLAIDTLDLGQMLSHLPALCDLMLERCRITSLAGLARAHPNLTTLGLTASRITQDPGVFRHLANNHTLQLLDLSSATMHVSVYNIFWLLANTHASNVLFSGLTILGPTSIAAVYSGHEVTPRTTTQSPIMPTVSSQVNPYHLPPLLPPRAQAIARFPAFYQLDASTDDDDDDHMVTSSNSNDHHNEVHMHGV